MSTIAAGMVTLIPTPCSNEPPPPPIPPPRKPWKCVDCARITTPVKRSGPKGPGTLCNACGIRIRKAKNRLQKAGAAAAAAAALGPKQTIRRQRQKKRPPPNKKKAQRANNKSPNHPSPAAPTTTNKPALSTPHPNTVPPPGASTVTAVPNPHVRATSPLTSSVAPGIVVPFTSAPQPALPPRAPRPCPSPSAPAPAVATSIPPSPCVGVISPSTGLLLSANVASPPVSSPAQLHPRLRVPPTTPEDIHMQSHPPHGPITSVLRQSSPEEETDPDDILSVLGVGNINLNADSPDSVNKTDKECFPGSMFAQADPTPNASSQVEVLNVFDGLPQQPGAFHPPISIVSVEEPYGEHSTVPASAGIVTEVMDAAAPTGWPTTVANPPMPMTTQPPLSASPGMVSPYDESFFEHELTKMDFLQAQISRNMSTIDDDIANRAQRHEQLTVERNEISFAISDLLKAKEVHRKRQQVVSENRARVNCMLQYLRKPERRDDST